MNKREFKHNIKAFFKKLKEFVKSDEFISGLVFGVCILTSVLIVSSCVNENRNKASAQTLPDTYSNTTTYETVPATTATDGTLDYINEIFPQGENIVHEFPLFMLPSYRNLDDEVDYVYIPALNTINCQFVYNTYFEGYIAYALPKLEYNPYDGFYRYSYDVYKPIVDFSVTGDVQTIYSTTYFNLDFVDCVYSYWSPWSEGFVSCAVRFWSMFYVYDNSSLFDLNEIDGYNFPIGWGGIVLTRGYYSFNRAYGTFAPSYFPDLNWVPSRFETSFSEKNSPLLNFVLKLDGYDENNTTYPAIYNVNDLKPCLLTYNSETQTVETNGNYLDNSRILLNEGVQNFAFETIDFRGASLNDVDKAYNNGFTDGKAEGYDEGYEVGHNVGEVYGYENGYNTGLDEGYVVGYDDGKDEGIFEGYDEGYDDGYDEGYDNGKLAGYDNGYNDGYADGLESNSGGGTYAEGYRDGLADGKEQASTDIYNLGYKVGYDDGFVDGRDEGFTEGYEHGLQESYDVGYTDGYNVGYDEGYDNGLDDGGSGNGGGFNLFRGLVKSVDTLFTTPIAGENITLGLILTTALGLTLLIVLLKTFLGG